MNTMIVNAVKPVIFDGVSAGGETLSIHLPAKAVVVLEMTP